MQCDLGLRGLHLGNCRVRLVVDIGEQLHIVAPFARPLLTRRTVSPGRVGVST